VPKVLEVFFKSIEYREKTAELLEVRDWIKDESLRMKEKWAIDN